MSQQLRILIAEHDQNDLEILHHELVKGGLNYESQNIQNEQEFTEAIKNFVPDLILSDYSFPSFNGYTAFKIRENLAHDIPFIFVSGTIGEENAVELIKTGVTDYALKDKLFTLVPKINRAIRESKEKQKKFRTEGELIKREKQLTEAQKLAKLGSWEVDFESLKVIWSEEICRIFEVNPKNSVLSYLDFIASIHPEDRESFDKAYKDSFDKDSLNTFEHRIVTPDGQIKFVEERWRVFHNELGQKLRAVGTCQDITERIKALQQLSESEIFNRGVLNSLSAHIAVVDRFGIIIAVNDAWNRFALENGETILQRTGIGSNYFKVCERSTEAGEKIASLALIGMKDVLNEKETLFNLEYPCHSPKKQRWFNMRVTKFGNDESMIVVAHENISERKLAEQNLVESEFRLNEAQEIAHLGSWEMNFETGVGLWSEETCRIYGLAPTEKKQTYSDWLSYVHPEDLDHVLAVNKEARNTLNDVILNHRILLKDGSIKHIYSKSKVELNRHGKPIGLYGIVFDVTNRKLADIEREKMVSDIIQRSKNLEQFAYIISHNLRSPVAHIMGLSNILKENLSEADRDKSRKFLFNATAQLDETIKDLNKILEVNSEITEYKEPVYFLELVKNIESSIQNLIQKEDVRIKTDFSAIDKITSIKGYIHSIFFNLISNSIKYRKPGKPLIIQIESSLQNEKIRISFADNGIGIDLELNEDKIFKLYKRFHLNIEGKGLGLFMVKTQVEALGGTIIVISEPDKGAEFIVELPI